MKQESNIDETGMGLLQKEFGRAAQIPKELASALEGQEVHAFSNDDYFTLYFPEIFNNQDLTKVYDRVFTFFPTAWALRTKSDRRIVQIPTADIP